MFYWFYYYFFCVISQICVIYFYQIRTERPYPLFLLISINLNFSFSPLLAQDSSKTIPPHFLFLINYLLKNHFMNLIINLSFISMIFKLILLVLSQYLNLIQHVNFIFLLVMMIQVCHFIYFNLFLKYHHGCGYDCY